MAAGSGDARYALIVAVSEYADSGLSDLAAPRRDAEKLAEVLERTDIGGFRSVEVLLDPDHATAQRRIEDFFKRRDPLDIAVLHFSGHGFRGEGNDQLFLAMRDTTKDNPFATSVPGDFLRGVIENSRARRKLVLLDCCHSGAFLLTRGLAAAPPEPAGRSRAAELFEASVRKIAPEDSQPPANAMGTVIIGAARATELARETQTGALTGAVVEGLETGDADVNRTGQISTENLFEYVTEWFHEQGLQQHPVVQQRSRSGRFIVARNCAFQPTALPGDVERLLLDQDPGHREEAVHHLRLLAVAADHDLAQAAFRRLQHLAQFDIDEQVTTAADEALYGMVPSARPAVVDFGRVRIGTAVAPRPVRILAPPPARGWSCRRPAHPAVRAARHGDGLEVRLDTTRPGRVDTAVVVDSVAGAIEVRITARISRPPMMPVVAGWVRNRADRLSGRVPAAGEPTHTGPVRAPGEPAAGPAPHPDARATWRSAGRRALVAGPAAVLVALLLTSFQLLPPAEVLGPCVPKDDLRVLTTDALRDAVEAATAGFAPRSDGGTCALVRVTVSAVTSDGAAQRQFVEQWPDGDLRVAGPSPDVWLPESSIRVGLARAAIPAGAAHRMELPADPAALSVASSPLVLAVPETNPLGGPLRREKVLAGKWTIPRADPSSSSAGLLATFALYGRDDGQADRAEEVLGRGEGGDDARYDLCAFRLSAAAPPGDTAFLVPQKYVTDYRDGKPLGAACQADQEPPLNRGLRAVPVTGAPGLDVPCVPILDSAWGDDQQRRLATAFCDHLRGAGGQNLRKHGLGPPDPAAAERNPDVAAADRVIDAWSQAQRPVRMLLALDVSGSMELPMPGAPGTTRMQAIKAAAKRAVTGRSLGRQDQVGLWEFATRLDGDRDYRELLPLAGATADQRTGLTAALGRLTATDQDTGLYDTISAGIARLRDDRPPATGPRPVNLLVVLTDGENDDDGSIAVSEIGEQLRGSGVQVAVIASVGTNCVTFRPLIEQKLGCFDAGDGGLDAAFEQALPSKRPAT